EPAQKVLEICLKALGPDHWQTADGRRAVEDYRTIARLPEEGRKALASTRDLEEKANAAREHAGYADSERTFRTLLEINRRWLGAEHPDTAQSYDSIGENLLYHGKYAEAEPLFRKALALRLKVLGAGHPDSAGSYNKVASTLHMQVKPAEADPLFRKALAIWLTTLGENHPDTAPGYTHIAFNLQVQGKAAEAEPLYHNARAS